jgi:hypothetical protein
MPRARSDVIRRFILERVESDPAGLSRQVQARFGITRQSAHAHLTALEAEGLLEAAGRTRGRRYAPRQLQQRRLNLPLAMKPDPAEVWQDLLAPRLGPLPAASLATLRHCVLALMENAIRHSGGQALLLAFARQGGRIELLLRDDGCGLFRKVHDDLGLEDPDQAPLELAKGGAGSSLLLAARAAGAFALTANGLRLERRPAREGWALSAAPARPGTALELTLPLLGGRSLEAVRAEHRAPGGGDFSRTRVPVELLPGAAAGLAGRAQATRLMAGLERYREVWLDWRGVPALDTEAAATIHREWPAAHPGCRLHHLKAAPAVEAAIQALT